MKGKKRSSGGGAMKVSGNPNVFKEAAERKAGGRVPKRKDGGSVKDVGLMTGGGVKARFDKPVRRSGGRVGANTSPLSTAHNTTSAESKPKSQDGGASD